MPMPPPPAVLFRFRLGRVREQHCSGQQRHAVRLGDFARAVLQAELAHLRGSWPDEGDTGCLAGFGEIRVLA